MHAVFGSDERNLPLGTLQGRRDLEVLYTWYEGRDLSHRLEFRRGARTVFEVFLPAGMEDVAVLSDCLSSGDGGEEPSEVFSFWERNGLRILAGKMVQACELTALPTSSYQGSLGRGRLDRRYRLAWLDNGGAILVSSKAGSHHTAMGSGGKNAYNWLRLEPDQPETLAAMLRNFKARVEAGG